MTSAWHSIFLGYGDSAARPNPHAQLTAALTAQGYSTFNPFGITPGPSYANAVRAFIAPPQATWQRILCEQRLDPSLCRALAVEGVRVLAIHFTSDDDHAADISAYADGAPAALDVLAPLLRPGVDAADLRRSQLTVMPTKHAPKDRTPSNGGLPAAGEMPLDALPSDVQALAKARGVDMTQAQGMFSNIGAHLLGRVGGNSAAAVGHLAQLDWNSNGGQRIRALMALLTIDDWQAPHFIAVRDAYQLLTRKQRLPTARDYPGDAEAMAAVPDALTYTPLYMGRA
jgi:hypothetical protein